MPSKKEKKAKEEVIVEQIQETQEVKHQIQKVPHPETGKLIYRTHDEYLKSKEN